jgi:AcrR family transcriptional regulator
MQVTGQRRSNPDRSEVMRDRLLVAARALFLAHGFAATSTPAVVAAAGVTRGALYHHFADKAALFAAVMEREAAEVAAAIRRADLVSLAPFDRLLAGVEAYLAAMAADGRAHLLLVQGPAVLGPAAMRAIEARHGDSTLKEGLAEAMADGSLPPLSPDLLTALLGAMFERAALEAAEGATIDDLLRALGAVLIGLSQAS